MQDIILILTTDQYTAGTDGLRSTAPFAHASSLRNAKSTGILLLDADSAVVIAGPGSRPLGADILFRPSGASCMC